MEGPFLDPGIPDGEETRYRGIIGGEPSGEGVHRVSALDGSYRQELSMRILDDAEYEATIEWKRSGGHLTAESYKLEASHKGEPVSAEHGWFRGIKALSWGGTLEPYPRDMAPLLGCALALRGIEFRKGVKRSVSLWLASTVYWEIEVRVEKEEKVELPFGELRAWRVRARPHFGHVAGPLDRVIQLVLPPFILHFEHESPHRFLRFEFPTGPFPWNPRGVIEALD